MEAGVMGDTIVVQRGVSAPAWWITGAALFAAGIWGLPLIESTQFENHFFGLFYYSILAGIVLFWALPSEQRFENGQFERRFCLLGLLVLWKKTTPLRAFSEIHFEQDPNLFRKDTVWVILSGAEGEGERLAFANFSATASNIAKAQALAEALSQATGLPIRTHESAGLAE
ncbi:hypothetical protein [uncultured Deefgea sp.]|uniref:hypothetical protein n=1 Tax=uncultured Deefgea sp. TaxID=1304914 RepID=UPI0025950E67|nr:hypothetical protein [uncultured Deefgea sp.]